MIRWPCRQCGEGLEVPDSMSRELVTCPKCGKFCRPPEDQRSHIQTAPESVDKPREQLRTVQSNNQRVEVHASYILADWVILLGALLTIGGFITTAVGVEMETTYSDTHNLGLLNNRLVCVLIGVSLGASGVVVASLGISTKALIRVIRDSGASK